MLLQAPSPVVNYTNFPKLPASRAQPDLLTAPTLQQSHPEVTTTTPVSQTPLSQARSDNMDDLNPPDALHDPDRVPPVTTYEAWAIKGQYARPYVAAVLSRVTYYATMLLVLTMMFGYIAKDTEPLSAFYAAQSPAPDVSVGQTEALSVQVDGLVDTRLNGRFMESYPGCIARGLEHFHSKLPSDAFQHIEVRQQAAKWTSDNCLRIQFTPQAQSMSALQIILSHLHRGAQVTEYIIIRARNYASRVVQHCLNAPSQWSGKYQSSIAVRLSDFAAQHLRQPASSDASVFDLPQGFNLTCETPFRCDLCVSHSLKETAPAPNVSLKNALLSTVSAFRLIVATISQDVRLFNVFITPFLLMLQCACACTYCMTWYFKPRHRIMESGDYPRTIHVWRISLTLPEFVAMFWLMFQCLMMLHSVSRKVLDNVLGSQRSYLCFLDCVVFVSITLLELFDHSFTNIDGIMGLVKELHDIATASVAIKSLHFPLDQEDPVEFDVHQKDLDENDVNSVDENTAAPFASVEDITDDQEIFDNDYIEGANESSDHEAELQFYPPTVASYAASQDSDDSEWSLVTAPESDALDDGSDQYMN